MQAESNKKKERYCSMSSMSIRFSENLALIRASKVQHRKVFLLSQLPADLSLRKKANSPSKPLSN
jgi:hypothetical protein